MTMKMALETSVVIFSLRNFIRAYLFLESKIIECYRQSYIRRLINRLIETVHLSYNFSFLKEFMGAIEEGSSACRYTSRFMQWLGNLYRKLKIRLIGNSDTSLTGYLTRSIGKEFNLIPIKSVSIVLVISIAVYFILTFIFPRELNIKVFFILSAFLIAGLLGLLCDADWATVKRDSIVLRILSKWLRKK